MTRTRPQTTTLMQPGGVMVLASSILARLPLAMLSIALLIHAQRLTGSFGVAGLVSGAYGISSAVSAPLLGRLVDRCGQTTVLVGGSTAVALLLLADGQLTAGAPAALLVALGAAIGISTPPLAACARTLLPTIVVDRGRLPQLFALESTVLELTFIAGPPLALGLAYLVPPGTALALAGLVMLAGTLAFAAQPASRTWRPDRDVTRPRGGSLRSPAMRTLVLILLATAAIFGATEVGVTAAAHELGRTLAAGPLLGLWGLGSFLGGIGATRLGRNGWSPLGLTELLAALALAHAALILTTDSVVAIGIVITVAGAAIAPTVATIYALVDAAPPAGTRTESFSWLLTAASAGGALGTSAAGLLAQHVGATAAFAVVAVAGALALVVALLGARSLPSSTGSRQPSNDAYRAAAVLPKPREGRG